jgi:hypothetical protein
MDPMDDSPQTLIDEAAALLDAATDANSLANAKARFLG